MKNSMSNNFVSVVCGIICVSSGSLLAIEEVNDQNKIIKSVKKSLSEADVIADINHHDLAKKEGVGMPISRLIIFNDKSVVVPIIKLDPLTGLDLPLRALSYDAGGELELLATNSSWLKARYDFQDSAK